MGVTCKKGKNIHINILREKLEEIIPNNILVLLKGRGGGGGGCAPFKPQQRRNSAKMN